VFVVALAAVFFAIHQFGSDAARQRMWRIDRIMRWFGAGAGVLVLLLCGLLVVMWWWQRDKAVVAAAKLAMAGRQDEAIDLLRRTIGTEGETSQRLNVLALLLHERERHAEALPLFERAEALAPAGAERDAVVNNRALALAKLGRTEEAIDLLRGVTERQPNDCAVACNLATTLADAGRETEAYEQLERAEQIYERYDERQIPQTWKAAIEACRERLPTARGFPVLPRDAGGFPT
jgi:tetratricopeptide (TPR) repeat protein